MKKNEDGRFRNVASLISSKNQGEEKKKKKKQIENMEETPEGLARCIEHSVAVPAEERAAMGARARATVEGVTWRTEAKKILAFIQSLDRRTTIPR